MPHSELLLRRLVAELRRYDRDVHETGRCEQCHEENAKHLAECPWAWISVAARKSGIRMAPR